MSHHAGVEGLSNQLDPDRLALAKAMAKRFRGRGDTIAVQHEQGFRPEKLGNRSPVDLLVKHLSGERCCGFYLLDEKSHVYCTAGDLDNKPDRPNPNWKAHAEEVYNCLLKLGYSPLVERSQSGDAAHVWLFFDRSIPAVTVRKFWNAIGPQLSFKLTEIYPRQDRIEPGKPLGNLIRYPLWNKSEFVSIEDDWATLDPSEALQTPYTQEGQLIETIDRLAPTLNRPIHTQAVTDQLPPQVAILLTDSRSRLARRWNGDKTGLADTSNSGLAMSIACDLVEGYCTTGEIEEALRVWGRQRGIDKTNRPEWIRSTVAKAYELVRNRKLIASPVSCLPYRPFPVEHLPPELCHFVNLSADALGCDPALIATPLLASLAGAIGNAARIQAKPGWTEPSVIWALTVAPSGSMKSPAFDLALKPLKAIQETQFGIWREQLAAFEATGLRGQQPKPVRHIVQDVTVEALGPLLEDNPQGVLLARDELSGFFGSFNAYKSGRGADEAFWLQAHRAEAATVDRKGGERTMIHVPHAAVSITGTIQPGTLARVLGDRRQIENGMAARFLFAMPPVGPKVWTDANVSKELTGALGEVFQGLVNLHVSSSDPLVFPLSAKAKELWIPWYNRLNEGIEGLADDLRAARSKIEAYALRFALVAHLVRCVCGDAAPETIDNISLESALALADWFAYEWERVYAVAIDMSSRRDRVDLAGLIREGGGAITTRELMRDRPGMFRSARDAESALDSMARQGVGHWRERIPSGAGRPTKEFCLANAA